MTSWTCALALAVGVAHGAETTVPITFTGGHGTDPHDGGRPVVLIAAALGVTPEVFRDAFRGVTPAKGGRPTPEQQRRNKDVLLKALKPHGVTNERLDEVSDHYRYRPGSGELWKVKPAKGHAVIEDGKVKRVVVTDAGAGYSTPPKATADGVTLKVTLRLGGELGKNGAVEVTAP